MKEEKYIIENRKLWNARVPIHMNSEFYQMDEFIKGKSSLKSIELELLGDVTNKSILHLQCHFGQDSLSMARMGAKVTGIDLSDTAIDQAKKLNDELGLDAEFICSDVYDLKSHLNKKFDIVFTSYGTIGWLPDLDKWADIIQHFLKPGGEFIFVEFHPTIWMFDDDFKNIIYSYFNTGPIILESKGTYTDRNADINQMEYGWNHGLSEVVNALIKAKLQIASLQEFDYSPYNCFQGILKADEDCYRFPQFGKKVPITYSIKAIK